MTKYFNPECPELEALERELALYAESTSRNILKQLSKYAEQAEAEQSETLDNMHKELKKKAFEKVFEDITRQEVLADIRNGAEAAATEQKKQLEKMVLGLAATKSLFFILHPEITPPKSREKIKATAKSRNPERKTIRAKAKHIEATAQPKPAEPERITGNQNFAAQIKGFFRKVQKIAASITF